MVLQSKKNHHKNEQDQSLLLNNNRKSFKEKCDFYLGTTRLDNFELTIDIWGKLVTKKINICLRSVFQYLIDNQGIIK